jgi:hypothetical protein
MFTLLTNLQAFVHSCLLFFENLGHVIDICKYAWVDLMEKYFKPLHTIFSTIAYQQDFKGMSKTCALKTFCHTQSFTINF